MPRPEDTALSALLEGLHQSPEESRVAWLQLREVLRAEPERLAAQLCKAVDAGLAAGNPLAVQASVILAVMACTKSRHDLVPKDLLQQLFSRAEQIDYLSLLCLANRLAQQCPEDILSKGLFAVLMATERALTAPPNQSENDVHEYAQGVAMELWHTVAERDPATLLVLLEQWAEQEGWQTRSSHLFAQLLVDTLPRHPGLLGDAVGVLEAIRARQGASPGEFEPPDRFIEVLNKLREKQWRKRVAQELAKAVAPVVESVEFTSAPMVPQAALPFAPDPATDRLIDDFLSPDPERASAAKERLGRAMRQAGPPLVQAVSEAADDLFLGNPTSDLFQDLTCFLFFATENRPSLTPVASLKQWAASDALDDSTLAACFAMLARVCPDWILKHMLGRAMAVALVGSSAFSTPILAGLARAWPELPLLFAPSWLEVIGWQEDLGPALCAAFEEAARAEPAKIDGLVALLDLYRGPGPGPGMIDLRSCEILRCIDRLRQQQKKEVS